TRPLTLSPALADSPAGLLAWLVEKYRAWTDGGGGPGAGLSDDYVLTQASLYWFTDTISTSFLPYWEYDQGLTRRVTRAPVPAGVAVFPADLTRPPRRWAERTLDVARYTV
ncbi:epoxide hydrolase, partial [Streptomyces sp. SID11233]|nr:epoxide hydrolase [Streptomyces sp. SID11233]